MTASKTSSNGSASSRTWLLYDADCGVCKVIVARILELDRRGRYRPLRLQDPRAAELLPGMSEEERMRSFHLVKPDGTVLSAGDGLAELLPPLRLSPRLSSRLYWLVAGNRAAIGKRIPRRIKQQAERRIAAESRSPGSGP